jgi:hypothetical protein
VVVFIIQIAQYYYTIEDIDRAWLEEQGLLVENAGSDAEIYPELLKPGLYFTEGSVNLVMRGTGVRAAGVTIVARKEINISGSEIVMSASSREGFLLFANKVQVPGGSSCNAPTISLSGSNISWVGTIYAPYGGVTMSASGNGSVQGAIVAYTVGLSGSQISIVYDAGYWPPIAPSIELCE